MTEIVIAATAVIGLAGVCVALWSVLDTRKKYYAEYISRKAKK